MSVLHSQLWKNDGNKSAMGDTAAAVSSTSMQHHSSSRLCWACGISAHGPHNDLLMRLKYCEAWFFRYPPNALSEVTTPGPAVSVPTVFSGAIEKGLPGPAPMAPPQKVLSRDGALQERIPLCSAVFHFRRG